jgi:hypothetical protein
MSLLGTPVFANPTTPLWLGTAGGVITGSLTVEGEVYAEQGFVTYDSGGLTILDDTGVSQEARLVHVPAPTSRTCLQSGDPLFFTKVGTANGNSSLTISAFNPGAPADTLAVGGAINSIGNDGFSVFTAAAPPVRKVAILNQAGQSFISSDDPIFFSRIGVGAQSSLTCSVAPADDIFATGKVVAQKLELNSPNACGRNTIPVAATNLVVASTAVTASSIIFVSHAGASAAGPGNGSAQGGLTCNPALIVPGVSFQVDLVDPATGIAVAASVVGVDFNYLVIN